MLNCFLVQHKKKILYVKIHILLFIKTSSSKRMTKKLYEAEKLLFFPFLCFTLQHQK